MSKEYDLYLEQHIGNVKIAFDWLEENLPEVADGGIFVFHDYSKRFPNEYEAYDRYFYNNDGSEQTLKDFNAAWLHHIHINEHHWQHWVLMNDDPELGTIALDMPYKRIIEMICDWWSFSWSTGNLYEIFNWYDKHKDYMILSDKTRETVEDILGKIRGKLDELEVKNQTDIL